MSDREVLEQMAREWALEHAKNRCDHARPFLICASCLTALLTRVAEERDARIKAVLVHYNPEVDALVSDCARCGDAVPFDVLIPGETWRYVPDEYRTKVLCLSCIDRVLPEGLDPASVRIIYASTSRGTAAFVAVKALQGEKP